MSDREQEQEYAPLSAAEAFGLDDEFKAPKESELSQFETPAPAEPQVLEAEYDFGYGPMKFQGETQDEITRKVIQAQNEHFQRLMLESGQAKQEYFPAPPKEYEEIPDPTNDELGAVMLSFSKDPVGAVRKLLEYNTKIPFDVMMEDLQAGRTMRVQKHAYDSGQSFVARHQQYDADGNHIGGDYFACPENAERICRLLEAEGRPETPEQMEYAWSKLRTINGLIPYPDGYFDSEEPDPQYQTSTAISGRDSYTNEAAGEFDDDAFVRAAKSGQLSLDQIENEIRKRKYAAQSR